MKKEIVDEKYIENRFKKFVYTSLQNCVKDYYKKEETNEKYEFLVDDFSDLKQTHTDKYFLNENKIIIMNETIYIENDELFEGLLGLDVTQREIVYLSIYEELSDAAISERLSIHRRTVQRIRKKAFEFLKARMELKNDE